MLVELNFSRGSLMNKNTCLPTLDEVSESVRVDLQNFLQHISIMKNISTSGEDSQKGSIEDLEDQIFRKELQSSKDYSDEITSNEIVFSQTIPSHSPQSEGLQRQAKFRSMICTNERMNAFLKFDSQANPHSHILNISLDASSTASNYKLSSQKLPMKKVQAENLVRELPSVHEGSDKNDFLKDSPPMSSVKAPTVTSVQHLQSSFRSGGDIRNYAENNITIFEHSAKQLVEFPHDKNMAVNETRVSGDGGLKEGVGHRVDRWIDEGNSNTTNIPLRPLSISHKDEMAIASSAQVDIDVPASAEPKSLHEISKGTAGYIDRSGHQARLENWVRRLGEIGIFSTSLTSDQPLTIITLEHGIEGVDIKFTASSKELTELLSRNQQELRNIFRQSDLQSYQFSFSNGCAGGHSSEKSLNGATKEMTPNLMEEVAVETQFFPATGVDKRI